MAAKTGGVNMQITVGLAALALIVATGALSADAGARSSKLERPAIALSVIVRPALPKGYPSLQVTVRNASSSPVKIWSGQYSWGYNALRLEVRDADGRVFVVRGKPIAWKKNYPAYVTLAPRNQYVIERSLDPGQWVGLPSPGNGRKLSVSVRAVYEVKPDPESAKLGVWTGTAESPWVPVILRDAS